MESALRAALGPDAQKNGSTISIAPEVGVLQSEVIKAMQVANRLKVPINLATKPVE